MKSIGIITIHKINNYGSVLQAYALQRICMSLGYKVEIIDYDFPNIAHANNPYAENDINNVPNEPKGIKALFATALLRQHKGILKFVKKYLNLSTENYPSPDSLLRNAPAYDIYMTGSDQLWSPRHCNGDTIFMLSFAPDEAPKISYAASFGTNEIPSDLIPAFKNYLSRYKAISVRERSGIELVKQLTGKDSSLVLDPTLLIRNNQWNEIALKQRIIKPKYILCYFLNYSFNAFPYVDDLAKSIQRQTGYQIVRVARPPHNYSIKHTSYRIGASPEKFLALIRDAEIVLTTSFHGTAFAVNYGRPLFSIINNLADKDSRQSSLMYSLGLSQQILELGQPFPEVSLASYDYNEEQNRLETLRQQSISYLRKNLNNE